MTEPGIGLASLWGMEPAVKPGPKPKLSITEITDAAITIACNEGLAMVTMARVAKGVGCSKMALYRYVSDRDDLLAVMLNTAIPHPPPPQQPWRAYFISLWETLLDAYMTHQWMLDLPDHLNGVTPNNVAWFEAGLTFLDESTMPPRERMHAILLMTENIRSEVRRRRITGQGNDLGALAAMVIQASENLSQEQFPKLIALARSGHLDSQVTPETLNGVRDLLMEALAKYFPEDS